MDYEKNQLFRILDEDKKYRVPNKEECLVAVNEWMQRTSQTEYVWAIFQINIRLAQMICNSPSKYINNYGDDVKNNCAKALSCAQIAQEIYIRDNKINDDRFNNRQKYLRNAIGYLKATMTSGYIFFELQKNSNSISLEDALTKEGELAIVINSAIGFLNKIINSDKSYYKNLK